MSFLPGEWVAEKTIRRLTSAAEEFVGVAEAVG